jgi:hypothetical protein
MPCMSSCPESRAKKFDESLSGQDRAKNCPVTISVVLEFF